MLSVLLLVMAIGFAELSLKSSPTAHYVREPPDLPGNRAMAKVSLRARQHEPAEAYVSLWSSRAVGLGAYRGHGELCRLDLEAYARGLAVPELCPGPNTSCQEKLNRR